MRLKFSDTILASVLIISVLASPGTPSSRLCPLAKTVMRSSSSTSRWPTITFANSASMRECNLLKASSCFSMSFILLLYRMLRSFFHNLSIQLLTKLFVHPFKPLPSRQAVGLRIVITPKDLPQELFGLLCFLNEGNHFLQLSTGPLNTFLRFLFFESTNGFFWSGEFKPPILVKISPK